MKPNKEGSTIGFSLIGRLSDLDSAIDKSLQYGDDVLIDKYIDGKEIKNTYLGDKAIKKLEIKRHSSYYDYKYINT